MVINLAFIYTIISRLLISEKILMPHHNGLDLIMAGSIPCNEATTDDFVDTQK